MALNHHPMETILISIAAVTVLQASGAAATLHPSLASMDVSFKLAVHGLGEAVFYTFQQPLPHPSLPYALQDEWVQYVYPDSTAAVYNVAYIKSAGSAQGLAVHQPQRPSVTAEGSGLMSGGAAEPTSDVDIPHASDSSSSSGRCTVGSRRQMGGVQQYVAVKAGDMVQMVHWFQQRMGDMAADSIPAVQMPAHSGWAEAIAAAGEDMCTATAVRSLGQQQCEAVTEQSAAADVVHEGCSQEQQPLMQEHCQVEVVQQSKQQSEDYEGGSVAERLSSHVGSCKHRSFMLYLGMSIPLASGGGIVTQQQLEGFLMAEVSPRVPGFTVIKGVGFWQGEVEQTTVLEVLSDADGVAAAVLEIAEAYKSVFKQDAVLIKENVCPIVAFV